MWKWMVKNQTVPKTLVQKNFIIAYGRAFSLKWSSGFAQDRALSPDCSLYIKMPSSFIWLKAIAQFLDLNQNKNEVILWRWTKSWRSFWTNRKENHAKMHWFGLATGLNLRLSSLFFELLVYFWWKRFISGYF